MQQFRTWISLFNGFLFKYSHDYLTLHAVILFHLYYILISFFVVWSCWLGCFHEKIILLTCICCTMLWFCEKELILIFSTAFWTHNLIKPPNHSTNVFLVYINIVVDNVSTFHTVLNCYFYGCKIIVIGCCCWVCKVIFFINYSCKSG